MFERKDAKNFPILVTKVVNGNFQFREEPALRKPPLQ